MGREWGQWFATGPAPSSFYFVVLELVLENHARLVRQILRYPDKLRVSVIPLAVQRVDLGDHPLALEDQYLDRLTRIAEGFASLLEQLSTVSRPLRLLTQVRATTARGAGCRC